MDFNQALSMIPKAYNVYENLLQRQSGEQVLQGCDNNTNCFFKDNEWMGASGHRTGFKI